MRNRVPRRAVRRIGRSPLAIWTTWTKAQTHCLHGTTCAKHWSRADQLPAVAPGNPLPLREVGHEGYAADALM